MENKEYQVKQELTNNRDLDFSKRHREYGFNVPAVDIDFLMLEYDYGKAVSLIEYKQFNAPHLNLNHTSINAIRDLAENKKGQLPAFVVYYYKPTWNFHVVPLNDAAKRTFKKPVNFSEVAFINFLYWLRDPTGKPSEKAPKSIVEGKSNLKLPLHVTLPNYSNFT